MGGLETGADIKGLTAAAHGWFALSTSWLLLHRAGVTVGVTVSLPPASRTRCCEPAFYTVFVLRIPLLRVLMTVGLYLHFNETKSLY